MAGFLPAIFFALSSRLLNVTPAPVPGAVMGEKRNIPALSSRLEPAPDKFRGAGIAFYKKKRTSTVRFLIFRLWDKPQMLGSEMPMLALALLSPYAFVV